MFCNPSRIRSRSAGVMGRKQKVCPSMRSRSGYVNGDDSEGDSMSTGAVRDCGPSVVSRESNGSCQFVVAFLRKNQPSDRSSLFGLNHIWLHASAVPHPTMMERNGSIAATVQATLRQATLRQPPRRKRDMAPQRIHIEETLCLHRVLNKKKILGQHTSPAGAENH